MAGVGSDKLFNGIIGCTVRLGSSVIRDHLPEWKLEISLDEIVISAMIRQRGLSHLLVDLDVTA